ncbi:MAG: hypothetical protein KGI06_04480 [Candidatus Micrarchaeota archaeon]|nr:hypothetical protein [Candidatus Micrarchaeota archaeon]
MGSVVSITSGRDWGTSNDAGKPNLKKDKDGSNVIAMPIPLSMMLRGPIEPRPVNVEYTD